MNGRHPMVNVIPIASSTQTNANTMSSIFGALAKIPPFSVFEPAVNPIFVSEPCRS
jgi:hypothetical protein